MQLYCLHHYDSMNTTFTQKFVYLSKYVLQIEIWGSLSCVDIASLAFETAPTQSVGVVLFHAEVCALEHFWYDSVGHKPKLAKQKQQHTEVNLW